MGGIDGRWGLMTGTTVLGWDVVRGGVGSSLGSRLMHWVSLGRGSGIGSLLGMGTILDHSQTVLAMLARVEVMVLPSVELGQLGTKLTFKPFICLYRF